MKAHKKWLISIVIILLTLSISSAICEPYAVSYTTYDTTYDAIIRMYINVINGKDKGRHDLFNQLIYTMYEMDPSQKENISYLKNYLGFLISDLNNDGQDDMIIGNPNDIYELFTIDNGKVRELIKAGDRYSCKLLDNGYLYRIGYSGASYASYELWKMNGIGKVSFVESYHTEPTDYDKYISGEDPDEIKWYYDKKEKYSKDQLVSSSEAEAWINQQEKHIVRKKAIPLAAYEQYSDRIESVDQIGILTVNGKTSGAQTVNIRSKPSKKSKVIQKSRVGTYILILGQEDGYYHVIAGKKEGYIQQDFVVMLDESVAVQIPTSEKSKYSNSTSDNKPSVTPKSQTTTVPDAGASTLAPTLYKGSQGQEIKDMQSRLAGLGYYTGDINGIFDEGTEKALAEFAENNNTEGEIALNDNVRRILYSVMAKPYSDSTSTPEPVIDHFEEREVQRSRMVLDHIETYYTYEDDGNGHLIETPHERPVYRSDYYTETELVPIYRPQ